MDWSKAKSIFIISFLVLNVILSYQLWFSREQKVETVQLTKSRVDEVYQMLNRKHIKMEAEIPKEAPDLNFLYVQYVIEDDWQISEDEMSRVLEFNPSIVVGESPKVEVIGEALKDVVSLEDYQVDSFMTSSQSVVFHQVAQGVPLFPSSLKVMIQNGQIRKLEQVKLKVLSRGTESKVISAFTAVRTLAESNYLPDYSTIVDIRIGYHGQTFNSDVQVLAPVWRLALIEGGIYYVNAITGAVNTSNMVDIKNTPLKKVE
jgi:regulatory protein YycI of two-component signal transduction system YycFG